MNGNNGNDKWVGSKLAGKKGWVNVGIVYWGLLASWLIGA